MMATAVTGEATDLICPLVDARRMEVYTAVYTKNLVEKIPPHVMILQEKSFDSLLSGHQVLFFGSGSRKFQDITSNSNAFFTHTPSLIPSLSDLAYRRFHMNDFADLAYTEPLYIKDFYSPSRKD